MSKRNESLSVGDALALAGGVALTGLMMLFMVAVILAVLAWELVLPVVGLLYWLGWLK